MKFERCQRTVRLLQSLSYIHIVIYGFALTVHLIWNFVFDSVQLHSYMCLTVILIHS